MNLSQDSDRLGSSRFDLGSFLHAHALIAQSILAISSQSLGIRIVWDRFVSIKVDSTYPCTDCSDYLGPSEVGLTVDL